MHKIEMPQHVIDGVMRRRGKLHIHDTIEAARTALLVIDMQDVFVAPGELAEVPTAREIVPNINRLASAMRAAGGVVVWVYVTFRPEERETWSVAFTNTYSPERADEMFRRMGEGGSAQGLWHELDIREQDWRVEKTRYSAFIQGASDIEARLRAAAIDTVVITGTLTNVCCDSTARDAMMRNFNVVMVAAATAAMTDQDHNASLGLVFQIFGDVMTCDEVVERLVPAERAPRAETGS